MKTVFDITEFGAVGDGMTDCTEAIQKALDKASVCRGKVVVPPGIYMTGKLKMHGKNVSMEGASGWYFRDDGASVFKLNDENADCLLDITGAFGVTIKGMSLNGCDLGENVHGIKIYWEEYNGGGIEDTPTIDDCRVGHFSGDGLHFEHVWCFSVRHSMLCFNGGAGLYIDGWDAFIIDNWFSANRNGGILGGPYVAAITCTGNRVEWNRRGGFVLPSGESYNITGNFFDRSFGPALLLGAKDTVNDQITVTGNVFRRNGATRENETFENPYHSSHIIMENCTGTTVVGNSMRAGRNDDKKGSLSPDYSIVVTDCAECVVKDNTMHKGYVKDAVITENNAETCIIYDNVGSLDR